MQFVIPYVDGSSPEWQKYFLASGGGLARQDFFGGVDRYRDEGTLYLLLQSIEMFAPWADVVLIVAMDSQVPDYVDRNKVKILTHADFVPDGYRKILFNSNAIESLIGNMPLAEQFVWLNDDIIFLNPVKENDFFDDSGIPVFRLSYKDAKPLKNLPSYIYRIEDSLINGLYHKLVFSQHGPMPYLMSVCQEFFNEHRAELLKGVEFVERKGGTHTQLSYALYHRLCGKSKDGFLFGINGALIKKPTREKWCCLNSGCKIDLITQLAKIQTYLDYRKMWG